MRTQPKLIAVLLLLLAAPSVAQTTQQTNKDDKQPPVKAVKDVMTVFMANGENLFVDLNGVVYQYVIQLNTRLPNAAALNQSLLSRLAQDNGSTDHLAFVAFTPSGDSPVPEPVEVAIGNKIPLKFAQAILAELGKIKEMQFAVSILNRDEAKSGVNYLNTRRLVIGSFLKSGKQAMTSEALKVLLDPNISHADFVAMIEKAK